MTLTMRNVGYRYAGAAAPSLLDIELELEPGSVLGVVGANGAGKSTLCLVVSGLAPTTIGGELTGVLAVDGESTAGDAAHELAQRRGILFQNPATQLSGTSSTVWEEVAFGPRNLGLDLADIVERVEEALAALGIEQLGARDPSRLSGGQAQLVALAGVLAMRPAYLVLDEPTSQLDPTGTELVAAAIVAVARARRSAVLLVEHKTDLLVQICSRVAVMDAGRIVHAGYGRDVLADERLEGWGVEPPSAVRLARAAARDGVRVPEVVA